MHFHFHNLVMKALPSGGLWIDQEKLLLVADLHLGKGGSYAGSGKYLPPYDSRATLTVLEKDMALLNPARVWCLGDSFHRKDSPEYLSDEDRRLLNRLTRGRDWHWVTGNHDSESFDGLSGKTWPGKVSGGLSLGWMDFLHQPGDSETADQGKDRPRIFGHYHPKVRLGLKHRRVSGKCFLLEKNSLLLPAYGTFTGGLWWPDPVLKTLFRKPRILFCHATGVTEVGDSAVRSV